MGYGDALSQAETKLKSLQTETVCRQSGARYENGSYFIKWFNSEKNLSAASDSQKILWMHYITAGGANLTGRLIAYREAAPALFYEPNFYKRAVRPLVKCFGDKPDELIRIGKILGGEEECFGDASVKINVLPYLPIVFIVWRGDEEFGPDGNILFDQSAKIKLCPEDLSVVAGAAVYEIINTYKKNKEGQHGS